MTKSVIIIGVGGYSANLVDLMHDANAASGEALWKPAGFLDDDPSKQNTVYCGLPVLGGLADAAKFGDFYFINAIGSTKSGALKPKFIERVGMPEERFVTLIHPSAYVARSATIGKGVAITQNCVVMANATIGAHVKILPLATVSYNCRIGDYSTIAGGAVLAADVQLGKCVYIGANAAVREFLTIGDETIVAMGGMVVNDVPAHTTVGGVPARPLGSSRQE